MSRYENQAEKLLISIISNQINIFQPITASKTNGGTVAEFCIAFTQKYSEHLRKLDQSQSPE